jgi:hypothetical protein
MRGLLLVCLLLFPTLALAQQPAALAGSDWNHVHALPVGVNVHVKTKGHSRTCNYESSDDDTFTCLSNDKSLKFTRAEIRAIQITRRGRSALIGMIPGAAIAAGSGITLASEKCSNQGFIDFCGLGAAVGVIFGGLLVPIGAGIGAGTDFARSTIYKAP